MWVPSLESMYSHILPILCTGLFCLCLLICRSVLCILDISFFSHIWCADCFFSLGRSPFKFWWFLLPHRNFCLMSFHLFIFAFVAFAFGVQSKRLFAKTNVETLTTCVFFSEVYGFRFYIQVIHPFKIFMCAVRKWSSSILLHLVSSFPVPFTEETVLSPLYIFRSCVVS